MENQNERQEWTISSCILKYISANTETKKKKKEREKSKFLLLEECQPINVNQMVKIEKSLFYNSHSNT